METTKFCSKNDKNDDVLWAHREGKRIYVHVVHRDSEYNPKDSSFPLNEILQLILKETVCQCSQYLLWYLSDLSQEELISYSFCKTGAWDCFLSWSWDLKQELLAANAALHVLLLYNLFKPVLLAAGRSIPHSRFYLLVYCDFSWRKGTSHKLPAPFPVLSIPECPLIMTLKLHQGAQRGAHLSLSLWTATGSSPTAKYIQILRQKTKSSLFNKLVLWKSALSSSVFYLL